jgi:hypothetical protein
MHGPVRSLRLVSALGSAVALLATLAMLTAATAVAAHADSGAPSWGPATPNFNLQVILRPVEGATDSGFGLVKFRQPKDAEKIVFLDVWVRDLGPNHSYLLQRAVDTNVNDDCTGTSWLTLGQGLVPQAISTDETGTGRANLFRNLASIPLGTEFDIHFRVIDATTPAEVLESACYQYTVSQ